MQIMKGAESFQLQGSNGKAVLLLHGYTGAPSEMRPLGDYLQAQGYTVLCVRLPGHGTSVDDLEQTTAEQWYDAALQGLRLLAQQYGEIYVAGLSMGALLAIRLTAEEQVAKAAFISAPIYVRDKRTPFLPLLRYFIRYLPKHKRNYNKMSAYCLSYTKMPTKPLTSLFALVRQCKRQLLAKITVPCLILQSRIEHTVQPRSAQYIYDHLGTAPERKRLLWFEHSGHILTLDAEHEQVFAAVAEFFNA